MDNNKDIYPISFLVPMCIDPSRCIVFMKTQVAATYIYTHS